MDKKDSYREIDIADLCIFLLKNWRRAVAFILVLVIAFSCLGLITYKRTPKTREEAIPLLRSKLSNSSALEVEDLARELNAYKEQYALQMEYNENSIFQKLNPMLVDTCNLQFYVDNYYEVAYPLVEGNNNIAALTRYYSTFIYSNEVCSEMSKQIDNSYSANYYKDLIVLNSDKENNGIISITLYALNKNDLETMVKIIKDEIKIAQEKSIDIFGENAVSLISEKMNVEANNEIYEKQKTNVKTLTETYDNISKLSSKYSDEDMNNYLLVLTNAEYEKQEVSIIKYVVIGIIVGFILFVLLISVNYLFTNKVRTVNEIEKILDTTCICEIQGNPKNNKFDDWIIKVRSKNKSVDIEQSKAILYEKIKLYLDKNDLKNLAIVFGDGVNLDIATSSLELLKEKELNGVCFIDSPKNNSESINMLLNVDNVVMIEQIFKSNYDGIIEARDFYLSNKINVCGVLVID